jgi:uncharacterized protein YfaS (alpha-2-macroglobulin family)
VQDYVKPPYKIDLTANKTAFFAGDTVTFTAKAGFFEGTPVADLDVSYALSSSYYNGLITSGNGQAKTDIDGKVEVSQKIIPQENAQGETYLSFTAEATLPEIGRTIKSMPVRVFVNDIDIRAQAKRTKGNAELTVDINSITLNRINDGTAKHYYDYLDAPVAGKSISVDIYRVYYEKVENGEYYDYIEKKVVTTYRYERKEEKINGFNMVTNKDGTAEKSFTVPDRPCESYFADITCIDGNGRKISQNYYIGYDYSYYWNNANSNNYFLDGANESYDIDGQVDLELKRGTETVTKGNFLYITLQRGIQSWQAGKNTYNFKFSKEHVPNITVSLYYFNGYNYQSNYNMSKTLSFDYSKNDLTLTAVTDKESYKPGDMCSITITAKDKNGNAKGANVNISIVDEALFALQDYSVDTLASLYRMLSPGLRLEAATHQAYIPALDTGGSGIKGAYTDGIEAPAPLLADMDAAEPEGGGDTYLREIFEDTALFDTVYTNERGEAIYTFKLPDNITSWRLTMSGISNDLYAGNGVQSIIVTNPMFLSYTLNDEFLIDDIPSIGVNVYGTSLSGSETVNFEVWDENNPGAKYTASGVAFERINIPLWEMKNEGANSLIVKASVSNGTSDAVKHQYTVHRTYRQIDEATYYDVTTNTVFDVGNGGLTNITFTDRGRGAFLRQLISLRSAAYGGDRIEKMLAHREADKIIQQYFPDVYSDICRYKINFDPSRYQRNDGGIAILPHADSDLETTVKLMPYIIDEINTYSLKNYLYSIYEGENAENKMSALYGLAQLREPVLLDLDNYSMLDKLSVKDAVYIALGYVALGETETASALYDNSIAPRLDKIMPYYRANTGVDQDDILEATSAANTLAAKLDKPEKDGLYQYCVKNYATDILINIEKLSHIEREISKRTDVSGSITYTMFGEKSTQDLKNGASFTLRIPAQNINEFKLIEVVGDVGAVSVYKKPMTEIGKIDNDLTVRRRYYKVDEYENSSNTFEQGDLIRIQIWIDYTKKAMNGSYCVTDYLPSGLEYVVGSAKIGNTANFGYGCYRYCTVEGQKVTFYDYNGRFDKGYLYYYYARVVSPGTFKAEGPLVQSLTAKDYFTIGEDSVITIK